MNHSHPAWDFFSRLNLGDQATDDLPVFTHDASSPSSGLVPFSVDSLTLLKMTQMLSHSGILPACLRILNLKPKEYSSSSVMQASFARSVES